MVGDNGWQEYKIYVLKELEELKAEQKERHDDLVRIHDDLLRKIEKIQKSLNEMDLKVTESTTAYGLLGLPSIIKNHDNAVKRVKKDIEHLKRCIISLQNQGVLKVKVDYLCPPEDWVVYCGYREEPSHDNDSKKVVTLYVPQKWYRNKFSWKYPLNKMLNKLKRIEKKLDREVSIPVKEEV